MHNVHRRDRYLNAVSRQQESGFEGGERERTQHEDAVPGDEVRIHAHRYINDPLGLQVYRKIFLFRS